MHTSVVSLEHVLPLSLDVLRPGELWDVLRPALTGRVLHPDRERPVARAVFVERGAGAEEAVERLCGALKGFRLLKYGLRTDQGQVRLSDTFNSSLSSRLCLGRDSCRHLRRKKWRDLRMASDSGGSWISRRKWHFKSLNTSTITFFMTYSSGKIDLRIGVLGNGDNEQQDFHLSNL